MSNSKCVIVLLSVCAACSSKTEPLPFEGVRDGGTVLRDGGETLVRDGGETFVRDGGEARDAGAVDAAPRRVLVEHHLLGNSPVDNLVMNPNLTSMASVGPYGGSRATVSRTFKQTPTRQGALEVAPQDTGILFVQSAPGLLTASVWVGRGPDASELDSVAILGVTGSNVQLFAELEPTADPPQTFGNITWTKREAVFTDPFIGNMVLFFTNDAATPLFITGPVVMGAQASVQGRLNTKPPVFSAAAKTRVNALLTDARRRVLEEFSADRTSLREALRPTNDPIARPKRASRRAQPSGK